VRLELGGGHDVGAGGAEAVGERLGPAAAGVGDDQQHVGIRPLRVVEQRGHEVLAGVLPAAHDHQTTPAEQRRADHLGQLTGGERAGLVLPDVGGRVGRPSGFDGLLDGARHQQFLVAEDELCCGKAAGHRAILARASD